MKKLNIAIKNKNRLTKELESIYDITYYEKPTLLSKFSLKGKKYPDIYFHQGSLKGTDTKEMIEGSKLVIVNSLGMKNTILEKFPNIDENKIDILYPYIQKNTEFDEEIKRDFIEKFAIPYDLKIILLSAKDLNTAGAKSLLKIASNLENKNFLIVIESEQKSVEMLKLQIDRMNIPFIVLLLEDYENKEELFIASDIFVYPTKQKGFSQSILKAMNYKNAVFTPASNFSSEIMDPFSIMHDPDDPSTAFKIDALLSNNDELESVQNTNHANSLKFELLKRIEELKTVIDKHI